MPTPHIEAQKKDIAKIVLMPGDPLRAKVFANTYLKNIKQINNVRGMLGFTGTLNGKKITVMAHGMGMSSIGIYAYELYKFYDVETIIRFGSCGTFTADINLFDIIIAEKCYEDIGFGTAFGIKGHYTNATPELVEFAKQAAVDLKINKKVWTSIAYTSEWFYKETNIRTPQIVEDFKAKGILVGEMEGAALYAIATFLNRKALVILTSSDNRVTNQSATSKERQNGFIDMFNMLAKIVEKL